MKDWVTILWVSFFVALVAVLLAAVLTLRNQDAGGPVYRAAVSYTLRDDGPVEPGFPVELMKVRAMTRLAWDEETAGSIRRIWTEPMPQTRVRRLIAEGTGAQSTTDLVNTLMALYIGELIEQHPDEAPLVTVLNTASVPTTPYDEARPYEVVLNSVIAGLASFMVSVLVLMRRSTPKKV